MEKEMEKRQITGPVEKDICYIQIFHMSVKAGHVCVCATPLLMDRPKQISGTLYPGTLEDSTSFRFNNRLSHRNKPEFNGG